MRSHHVSATFALGVAMVTASSTGSAQAIFVQHGAFTIAKLGGQVPTGPYAIDTHGMIYSSFGTPTSYFCTDPLDPTKSNPPLSPPETSVFPFYPVLDATRTAMITATHALDGRLKIYRLACGSAPETLATLDAAHNLAATETGGGGPTAIAASPSGEVCLGYYSGNVYCVDTKTGTMTLRIAGADVEAFASIVPKLRPLLAGFSFSLEFAPDGRLFMLMTRLTKFGVGVTQPYRIRWVLSQAPGEKPKTIYSALERTPVATSGPEATTDWNPLRFSDRIQYFPPLKAMIVTPILGWDFMTAYADATTELPGAFAGVGVRVFPLSDRNLNASGYFSLDRLILTAVKCNSFYTGKACPVSHVSSLTVGKDDKLELVLTDASFSGSVPETTSLYTVDFDPQKLDLDDDGLEAKDEAAMGTSDYTMDSDDGWTRDDVEKLLGKNPKLVTDDPVRFSADPFFSWSPLIRLRLKAIEDANAPLAPADVKFPWCSYTSKKCYGPKGEHVYDLKGTLGLDTSMAPDGTFIVDSSFVLHRFADGSSTKLADTADVAAALGVPPGTAMQIIAGDATHVFVVAGRGDSNVVALIGSGAPRLVFDFGKAAADSGLKFIVGASLPGFNPLTRELLLSADTRRAEYLVGISLDGTPRIVLNDHVANEDGTYSAFYNPFAIWGPMWVPNALLDTGHELIDPFDRAWDYSYRPHFPGVFGHYQADTARWAHRAWGDTLIMDRYSSGKSGDGTYEVVRYESHDLLHKGDLLVAGTGQGGIIPTGTDLFVGSPRGGLVPLTGHLDGVKSAEGLDVDLSGNACLADSIGNTLYATSPDASNSNAPTVLRFQKPIAGIVDCKIDDSGNVHALANGPPRVEVYDGAGKLDRTTPVNATGALLSFFLEKDGSYHVVDGTKGVTGALRLSDGRLVEIARGDIEVDGVTTGVQISTLFGLVPAIIAPGTPESQNAAPVHLSERADHALVLMPYKIGLSNPGKTSCAFYLDLTSRKFERLFINEEYAGESPSAMVVLPGGKADPLPASDAGPGGDTGPGGDGGTDAGAGGDGGSGGCGCRTANESSSPAGAALAVACATSTMLRRRRRRRAVKA